MNDRYCEEYMVEIMLCKTVIGRFILSTIAISVSWLSTLKCPVLQTFMWLVQEFYVVSSI